LFVYFLTIGSDFRVAKVLLASTILEQLSYYNEFYEIKYEKRT
jgi:hypothetical protein